MSLLMCDGEGLDHFLWLHGVVFICPSFKTSHTTLFGFLGDFLGDVVHINTFV